MSTILFLTTKDPKVFPHDKGRPDAPHPSAIGRSSKYFFFLFNNVFLFKLTILLLISSKQNERNVCSKEVSARFCNAANNKHTAQLN